MNKKEKKNAFKCAQLLTESLLLVCHLGKCLTSEEDKVVWRVCLKKQVGLRRSKVKRGCGRGSGVKGGGQTQLVVTNSPGM